MSDYASGSDRLACPSTTNFSDEPVGNIRRCSLPEGHKSPHMTSDYRWWDVYPSPQPSPQPNSGPAIVDLVIADIHARDLAGQERYGTRLQSHNGRDALWDAYEEALDLAIYLRQVIDERPK